MAPLECSGYPHFGFNDQIDVVWWTEGMEIRQFVLLLFSEVAEVTWFAQLGEEPERSPF